MVEKLRDRSPISSPAAEPAMSLRTRPCESIAASASSRSRPRRLDRREAKARSASAPAKKAMSVTATICSRARLYTERAAFVVSSATTAAITCSPDQIG